MIIAEVMAMYLNTWKREKKVVGVLYRLGDVHNQVATGNVVWTFGCLGVSSGYFYVTGVTTQYPNDIILDN